MKTIGPYLLEAEKPKSYFLSLYKNLAETSLAYVARIKIPAEPKVLGTGNFGMAFDIGEGKVLKITVDESEAHSSATLAKKWASQKLDNVVEIFGVYDRKDWPGEWYVIQEKLDTASVPSGFEKVMWQAWNNIRGWLRSPGADSVVDDSVRNKMIRVGERITIRELGVVLDNDYLKIIRLYYKEEAQKYGNPTWPLDVFVGLNSLYNAGIRFEDLHKDNVGMRNGKVVIFDIGFSRSSGGGGAIQSFARLGESLDLDGTIHTFFKLKT